MKRLTAAVLIAVAGTALIAQSPPQPIAIDVVIEGALPKGGLTVRDFAVSESSGPVALEALNLVRTSTDTTPLPPIDNDVDEQQVAPSADRLIGVVIDEFHLDNSAEATTSRAAVAAFVRSALGPRDLVLVARPLDSLVSLRLTGDRNEAARLIEDAQPRLGDYTARSAFEQQFFAGAPSRIDAARNQVTLSTISAVTQHLGRFPGGRKTLIILSDRIPAAPLSRGEGPLPGLDSIVRVANRGRVAIYPVRPGAEASRSVAQPVSSTPPPDPLTMMAAQTTGFVIEGVNVAAGLQRVLADASGYYLLTLQPAAMRVDGRTHAITVTTTRTGLTLRARAAYAAPAPDERLAPRPSGLPEGLKIPRRTSALIRTWFGQEAGSDGKTSVAFVWEPAARVPAQRGPVISPARVSLSVMAMDGTPLFDGTSSASGGGMGLAPGSTEMLSFLAAPGPVVVQMDILDTAGRVIDRDVRDLAVTAFAAPLTFGTASVYRSRVDRDVRALVQGASTAAPVAARQFSRAEHLVVRVPVQGTVEVTAVLKSRFGSFIRQLPVTRVGDNGRFCQVDLSLAALASGGYSIEFGAHNGKGAVVGRVEFTVTP